MKLSLILLFVSSLQVSAFAVAQKITIKRKNVALSTVLKDIQKLSGYNIFYDSSIIPGNAIVSLNVENAEIDLVLADLLNKYDLIWKMKDRNIVLSSRLDQAENKPKTSSIFPIQRQIVGTVINEKGESLAGVSIYLKSNKDIGTTTDQHGRFAIAVPPSSKLVIQFIGYKAQELDIGNQVNLEVTLEPLTANMDEVVVTAYGNQKKASIIGAIETIEPEKLRVGSTRSMSNNLAGQVAGVIAVQRSGEPGFDNSSFWIRGISTFSGATNPLVLIDGVERDLNNIDPAEIESFSVLKDASASAMYGVRGANGVIVINTKRGKVGKPTVNVRMENSTSEPTKLPDYIGAVENMELRNSLAVDQTDLPFSLDRIEKTRTKYDPELYPDVNWIDAVTKDYAYSTRANLTVNGGSNFLRYALITSLFNEKGIIETDRTLPYDTGIKLNRYNVRANVDVDITGSTTLRLNVGGYLQDHRRPHYATDEILWRAFTQLPYAMPIRYSDGKVPYKNIAGNAINNPWGMATQYGYDVNTSSQIQSLVALEQDLKMITPGLKTKLTFSFDSYSWAGRSRTANPSRYDVATQRDEEGNLNYNLLNYGDESLGLWTGGNYGNKRTYLEGTLTYRRLFGKNDLDALLLYNQQSYDDGSIQPYRKQGTAGRLSYTYDGRYIAEFNFGYNGSENFAKGKRFGFFPSFAVGWYVSEESFMSPFRNVLSKLKLRGSYGKVGNDNIGGRRFAYITTVSSARSYQFGEDRNYYRDGYTEGEIGVDNLTWETAWKGNAGIEIGLWNALEFQVDLFQEKRSDIFMQRSSIPTQAGYSIFPWANFGKVENKGVELSLNINKKLSESWGVGARSTLSYAKNKVLEKDEPTGRIGYRAATGKPLNTLWGLTADRLFTRDDFDDNGTLLPGIPVQLVGASVLQPGDIKYVDRNNDGQITEDDEGYIGGTVDPKLIYGFGANVNYRQWDLSFFFQGMGDTYRIIGGDANFLPGADGAEGNIFANYQDRWTADNPSQNVFYPRLYGSANRNNYRASTWWKNDMSFLRCRTIEVGYSLPKSLVSKVACRSVRFYASGNNMFNFSKFKLWDPEIASSNGGKYPQMRSVMVGLDVNF